MSPAEVYGNRRLRWVSRHLFYNLKRTRAAKARIKQKVKLPRPAPSGERDGP